MIFITSFSTYINDFFNKVFLLLRLPKTNTSSQVGTIKPSPIPKNQGTPPTVKGKPIKTYIPHNPVIKGEPVYVDTVVPISAIAIANLRKANMSAPVSQSKEQSNQQSQTLTNQNLLVSTTSPTKTKGITQIILNKSGNSSSSSGNSTSTIRQVNTSTSKTSIIDKLRKPIVNPKLRLTRR